MRVKKLFRRPEDTHDACGTCALSRGISSAIIELEFLRRSQFKDPYRELSYEMYTVLKNARIYLTQEQMAAFVGILRQTEILTNVPTFFFEEAEMLRQYLKAIGIERGF